MKVKVWLTTILFAGVFASCEDQENNAEQMTAAKINQLENTAVNGSQWRVTYFFDANADETARFNGYVFSFDSGNMLIASDGSNNHSGTWGVSDALIVDGEKATNSEVDFNIVFNAPVEFQDLNENWEIVSFNELKIELRHLSGGNGGADLLTFERI